MARPKALDDTEMSAWLGFLDTHNLLQRRIDEQLRAEAGLSQMQYEILTRLEVAGGGKLRMTELAERLIASRSGLTYQISQLEQAGFVRRGPAADDDRGVVATLTARGGQALRKAAPGHAEVVRQNLLAALTAGQITELGRLMRKTSSHLRGQQEWPRRSS